MLEIAPFSAHHLPAAADLFVSDFARLRQAAPHLPEALADPRAVRARLERLIAACPAVAALSEGRLVGYLAWLRAPHFRDTPRLGAYCPEWAHAADGPDRAAVYRALYRAVSTHWAAAACQVHAITLLAGDAAAERAWFWNGFGLTVIDAIRSLDPLDARALRFASPSPLVSPKGEGGHGGLSIRPAAPADIETLVALDAEHWRHYTQPPVFMAPHPSTDAAGFSELLGDERNTVWLALDGDQLAGFMRFEGSSFGAAAVVNAADTTAITGAFVRPAYRGRGIAPALLDAALCYYNAHGYARCAVDFESFNPEAAAFWLRYFQPVCLSLTRIPEALPE